MILDRAELIAEAVRTGTLADLPGGHFIDGHFVDSASARRMESFDPGRGKAFATVGSDLALMLTGPVDVTERVLKKAGMSVKDIDLFELNEAFSSVVLRYQQALDIDDAILNVNGGAIAMGHPLGATGAMVLGTVLDELERQDKQTALVTLCVAVGMGVATIIERV